MKNYVENKINKNVKKENQIVIVSVPTGAKKQGTGTASGSSSSSSSSNVAEAKFKPEAYIPLTKQAYNDYTLDSNLVAERAKLIAEVTLMLAEKQKGNNEYKKMHNEDNPKIALLQNARDYLRGENEFYDSEKPSVEQKYWSEAVSKPADDKDKTSVLNSKFQKVLSGKVFAEETPLLLEKVQEHHKAVKAAHEQSNMKDRNPNPTKK